MQRKVVVDFSLTLDYMISWFLSLNISNTYFSVLTAIWVCQSAALSCFIFHFLSSMKTFFFLFFCLCCSAWLLCALTEIQGFALISWHLTLISSQNICALVCVQITWTVCVCVCVCRGSSKMLLQSLEAAFISYKSCLPVCVVCLSETNM